MPSPFPGMDPYLEDPALWPDVHARLITTTAEMLVAQLRPRYFVQIEERLYLAEEGDEARDLIVPDIHIRHVERPAPETGAISPRTGLAIAPGIEVEPDWKLEVRERRLTIIDRDAQRVVTVLEYLSPANKVRGSAGKQNYDEKKQEILSSETNLVEIDLLRHGTPLYARPGFEPSDYLAQVWRWTGEPHRRWVWRIGLQEKLPTIPVPVKSGDEDAAVDLQAVLASVYDRAGYDLRLDYAKDPVPPLRGQQVQWARELVARAL